MSRDSVGSGPLKTFDYQGDGIAVSAQCRNRRASYWHIGMAEKYARNKLSVIIQFGRKPGRNLGENHHIQIPISYECLTFYRPVGDTVFIDNMIPGMDHRAENWRDLDMFIRIVELVEIVEVCPLPADKGFRGLDGVYHPLTGCFYPIAGGFETDPTVACRELEVAILRAVIPSDEFPRCMVEGTPQIVDSVAYYRGNSARQFFNKSYAECERAGRIGLDTKSIWFFGDEGSELPFELGNVVIGPLDFLFGAVEHV